MNNNILIVSSDKSVISPLTQNFKALTCVVPSEVIEKAEQKLVNLVVIDQDCCELNALSLYKDLKNISAELPVILVSSSVTIPQVVEATKLGMRDIVKKPFTADHLIGSVKENLVSESGETIILNIPTAAHWMATSGGKMRTMIKMIEASIRERKNILLISEPGTDTSSIVDIISANNPWGRKVSKLDMSQYAEGAEENVFWTVLQGYLAEANTIYFNNFDSAAPKTRTSVIEYVKKRSGNNHVKIVASVRDIPTDEFADWIKIIVPSMKDRKEDLTIMMNAYLSGFCEKYGKKIEYISRDVLDMFSRYSWPGNYREFEAVLENAVLSCEGNILSIKDIQLFSRMLPESFATSEHEKLIAFRRNAEEQMIGLVYKKTGSKEQTAHVLDIPKTKVQESISS